MLMKNKSSPKTDEASQVDEKDVADGESFSMTVFNSVKEEDEDGNRQKVRSPFEDIIELEEEEESDETLNAYSSKDVQNSAMNESIVLRKSLRKGDAGMYFEEYLV